MVDWIIDNWVEIFGALTGLLYIYFSIKENILLWPIGLISCTVYIFVFFDTKFYADMTLQIYYVIISVYGWYYWKKEKQKDSHTEKKNHSIVNTPKKQYIPIIVFTVLIFLIIGYILDKYTDSTLPYGDAITTSLGIIGTWMLAKKHIENWLVWIVADFISVGLYFYKELYPTVILYLVFAIMAIVGYFEWKKTMLAQNENS